MKSIWKLFKKTFDTIIILRKKHLKKEGSGEFFSIYYVFFCQIIYNLSLLPGGNEKSRISSSSDWWNRNTITLSLSNRLCTRSPEISHSFFAVVIVIIYVMVLYLINYYSSWGESLWKIVRLFVHFLFAFLYYSVLHIGVPLHRKWSVFHAILTWWIPQRRSTQR